MKKEFNKVKITECCPKCGNEELVSYFNDYYCDKCNEILCYGDLEPVSEIVGKITLDIREDDE
ncbi:MAG: hypothetical protein KHZ90_08390 [Veillonella parvula]|uniref:Uncharacterized protein n=1 Tax=Veillonella parvula TaxID=29466 RepID=A0A942WVN0_VEIPA|nr:hypothetical protein [Veillonella parvula]MBS4893779.1 hypothetical protein [Veillonella parvula]